MTNDNTPSDSRSESLMNIGWLSYILHLIVAIGAVLPGTQASVALLLLAFLLDLVKKSDAAGSWQASHFEWRISSVIWAGVAYIVTLPLWLLFLVPGWIAWGIISIWFLYRIVKGMVRMSEQRAVA
jgi:uncharacterized membrane protein